MDAALSSGPERGTYFHDGKRLLRLITAIEGHVLLEDSQEPYTASWWPQKEFLKQLTLVEEDPAKSGDSATAS